jgi:hypothetical protein
MKLTKLFLGTCALSMGIASAASLHLRLADATWVGQSELKPGEYQVKVDDKNVTFKQGKTVVAVTGKMETGEYKYRTSQFGIVKENGQNRLKEIDLGGTKSKVVLGEGPAGEAGTH